MKPQENASSAQLLAEVENVNKDKIDNEKVTFIFEEIKERLKATIEFSNEIDKKIHNFILLKIAIIWLFAEILFKTNSGHGGDVALKIPEMNEFNMSIIVFIVILMIGLIQLGLVLSPKKYFTTGSSPQEIYKKSLLEKELEAIKISIGASYQERLNLAEENRKNKAKKLKLSLYMSIIGFAFLILTPFLFFLKARLF